MVTFRMVWAIVALFLIGACGSPPTAQAVPASPSSNPTPATSPSPNPTPAPTFGTAVLVGHTDNPPTVILMRLDGSIVTTLPGVPVVDQHAVGAYLVVASFGSRTGWTVDASGTVKDVAPAALAILSPTASGSWTPPLIVDSTTVVAIRWAKNAYTAYAVDLGTGAVRALITVPQTNVMSLTALTLLGISPDRQTVWLARITPTGGITGRLDILGIDLQTGKVSIQGQANALAGAELAITPDGKWLAGQQDAGTNSSHLAIRHLHVVSLGSKANSDVQGTALYVGGQRSPSVLFAPGGGTVAWWGGLNNGSISYRIDVATVKGPGRTLKLDAARFNQIMGVFWADANTLVVQTGFGIFTMPSATGTPTLVSQDRTYIETVLN